LELSFKQHKDRVKLKARSALAMVCGMGLRGGHLSVRAAVNLWGGLVRSQLEYGSEIWGGDDAWLDGEQIQHEMARRILRCHSQTARAAMMGDLGWWRLRARRDQRRLLYWGDLVRMPADRFTKMVYLERRKEYEKRSSLNNAKSPRLIRNWCHVTKQLLRELDLLEFWNEESRVPEKIKWRKVVISKIALREQNLWLAEVLTKPKLRTYRLLKDKLRFEPYLLHGSSLARSVMFSLRSGSNRLRIETGRWKRPQERVEERVCVLCESKEVEDEIHFISKCEKYGDLRSKFCNQVLLASQGKENLHLELDPFGILEVALVAAEGSGRVWDKVCQAALNFVFLSMKRRAEFVKDKLV